MAENDNVLDLGHRLATALDEIRKEIPTGIDMARWPSA
jgi:hypothetical protein